jgi:hypothetical protein
MKHATTFPRPVGESCRMDLQARPRRLRTAVLREKPTWPLVIIVAAAVVLACPGVSIANDPVVKKAAGPAAIVGDGVHDDTGGIQTLLDAGRTRVYLPPPPVRYLIGRPLRIHSNQTLLLDRFTVIRLKDLSDCLMITNDDYTRGNENIALVGGVWDMNNLGQSLSDYQKTGNWKGAYNPSRYLGVLMRFDRVKNLTLRGLTLKDPVTFSTQLGNLDQFTVEDITFDHNLKRTNMDGIHVHGNSRLGRIANLKGATNDDMVALNADDGGGFEMARGPIEDVAVDGIWAKDGYTAVRLLSAGSPLRRIQIANVFGTYRYNAVSLTNHRVHPGSESTFEDISLRGLFCSKSGMGLGFDPAKPGWSGQSLVWIDAPAAVSCLSIADLHRSESLWPAAGIFIEPGATVRSLQLNQAAIVNRTPGPLDLVVNRGTIEHLGISQVRIEAAGGPARGAVVRNGGKITRHDLQQVSAVNAAAGIVEQ